MVAVSLCLMLYFCILLHCVTPKSGRTIAQAVSRQLSTAATRVHVVMWDFVMDKSGAGAGFLRELRFPLPIYIPSASP
jgi:hypothetical protein